MKKIGEYELLGETLDDAVGEAYDKTARMLGLGYPGGCVLTEMAKRGNTDSITFPIPMAKNPSLDFSFSGLKTAVYYTVKKITENDKTLTKEQVYNFSRSFEVSAISQLQIKLEKAIKMTSPKMILVGGGVTASARVRRGLRNIAKKYDLNIYFPEAKLATDNGAMIALVGYFKYLRNEFASMDLDRDPVCQMITNPL
jgi:N6-L-threonylcarbamoyladenine synthase